MARRLFGREVGFAERRDTGHLWESGRMAGDDSSVSDSPAMRMLLDEITDHGLAVRDSSVHF